MAREKEQSEVQTERAAQQTGIDELMQVGMHFVSGVEGVMTQNP